mgnify:CR=1 FL=1
MNEITDDEKTRIIQYIEYSKLDYIVVDNYIGKFHLIDDDGIKFFFYKHMDSFIIMKYDPNKDAINRPELNPYEYIKLKSMLAILQYLTSNDEEIGKSYWTTTKDSIQINFDKNSYKDDWFKDIEKEAEFTKVKNDDSGYKYLTYENPNLSPELKSPYNTISNFSFIDKEENQYQHINMLYFEIHHISCQEKNEQYLLKLLCNNEEVLKEYINYIVSKKKGLKRLINEILSKAKQKNKY